MTQDVEKPLLSDYEVLDEKAMEASVVAQQPQSPASCRSSTLSAQPATQCDRHQKFQKFEKFVAKVAGPLSRKSVGLGCEPFTPQPIEEECQKAARIINKFSYNPSKPAPESPAAPADPAAVTRPEPASSQPHIVTIPPCVIADAIGILIFTTGRLGFGHMSGSTGSGLLVVRGESGEWGTPVPVQAYSLGGGPLAFGAEVSDRVYVFNNTSALELFNNARFELGPEVVLAAGPHGGGGGITFSGMSFKSQVPAANEGEERTPQPVDHARCSCGRHRGAFQGLRESLAQPVYCYMHSRGLYAGLQAEGTVFVQHHDQTVPESAAAVLFSALKEAEGVSQ